MVRSALLIFNQGVEILTRQLFRALQPYLMPERLAPLLTLYGGSSQTFGFPNHGWLAVVSVLVLGYTLEPSVPRFNLTGCES
ncbi:hypothetical protein [Limnospira indica]